MHASLTYCNMKFYKHISLNTNQYFNDLAVRMLSFFNDGKDARKNVVYFYQYIEFHEMPSRMHVVYISYFIV